MKKLKFLQYIIVVIIGVFTCDFIFSFVIESIMKNRYNEQIYKTYSASTDIAILGASRTVHHYVPKVFKDSLTMTATNYGISAQNIFTHYAILQSLINNAKKKPKIIILEVGAIDINDTPKWNTEKLNVLYPYFNSEDSVRTLLKDLLSPAEYYAVKFSGLYRHNSKCPLYVNNIIRGQQNNNGYSPLHRHWNKPIEFEEEHGITINPKKVEYMKKFISLCKAENIYLIIAVSPNFKILPNQKWLKKMRQIASDNKIPFLYHENDSLFLNHGEWFNEPFHLNDDGAHIYSAILAIEIKSLLRNSLMK